MHTAAIQELKSLRDNRGVLSVAKVEWWLLKYQELYNNSSYKRGCGICMPVAWNVLCDCDEYKDEKAFISQFKEFENLCNYHRNEPLFKRLLTQYHSLKSDPKRLKEFAQKHEDLVLNKYSNYWYGYMSELVKDTLFVKGMFFDNFDVYVSSLDFPNTEAFILIYNKLYYDDEILPESIAILHAEMEANRDGEQLETWVADENKLNKE